MTITQSRAEMSELGVKLTAEQQKVDRQMTINDQLGTQMREMQKELKVGPLTSRPSSAFHQTTVTSGVYFTHLDFGGGNSLPAPSVSSLLLSLSTVPLRSIGSLPFFPLPL